MQGTCHRFQRAQAHWQGPSRAVGGAFGTFLEFDPSVLNRHFQVNTMGLLYLARRLAPGVLTGAVPFTSSLPAAGTAIAAQAGKRGGGMNDLFELALRTHGGMDRSSGPAVNDPMAVLIQIPEVVVS